MLNVAVAGLVCVDLRPELDELARFAPGRLIEVGPLSMRLGGLVGNTGTDLLDLGVPLRFECGVGADELGQYVRDSLRARGADISGIRSVPEESTSYSLILEPRGVDRTIWHSIGANARFDGRDITTEGIDILHVGYPALLPSLVADGGAPIEALLTRTRAAGITTSVDLSFIDTGAVTAHLDWHSILRRMARQTDVLSPSLDDLTSALHIDEPFSSDLVSRLLDDLLDWGVAVAAISAGEHGLFLRCADRSRLRESGRALSTQADRWASHEIHLPPVWNEIPVTTNGAGDATSAGLLFGLAIAAGPAESARLAAACSGALVSGRRTTTQSIIELCPDLAELVSPYGARH